MKRPPITLWIQLFGGLMIGVIGTIISYQLAILFYIKYAGLDLIFMSSSGDGSPVTFTLAALFIVLTLTLPTLLWFFLNKVGDLKSVDGKIRMITLILFATVPLWTYIGHEVFLQSKTTYSDYREEVEETCIIKDGVNKKNLDEITKEFECRNGVLNGFTKTYNAQDILIYEGSYLNGELNGTETVYYDSGRVNITTTYKNGNKDGAEIFYTEDGNTNLYIINEQGKSRQVYFRIPEDYLFGGDFDLETQNFFCKNQGQASFKYYSYTCLNDVMNGELTQYDWEGTVVLKVEFTNGIRDGVYEHFTGGKLLEHLEFRNGKLEGKVQSYNSEDNLLYEGQYTDGLQNGVFRRYDYDGNIESEVVFEHGQLVKINKFSVPAKP